MTNKEHGWQEHEKNYTQDIPPFDIYIFFANQYFSTYTNLIRIKYVYLKKKKMKKTSRNIRTQQNSKPSNQHRQESIRKQFKVIQFNKNIN